MPASVDGVNVQCGGGFGCEGGDYLVEMYVLAMMNWISSWFIRLTACSSLWK
jgi:hypothetical protein